MICELHISGLDCTDHDQWVKEDCKTQKTEFNHHIFVQTLKMTRGYSDLYRKKILIILVKGKSHFCIDQYFAKRKELHYLNQGGGGGALNMKTTIDCTRSLHNLYSRLRFLGFTLSTYSHIMQVLKFRFMRERIFFHLLFII